MSPLTEHKAINGGSRREGGHGTSQGDSSPKARVPKRKAEEVIDVSIDSDDDLPSSQPPPRVAAAAVVVKVEVKKEADPFAGLAALAAAAAPVVAEVKPKKEADPYATDSDEETPLSAYVKAAPVAAAKAEISVPMADEADEKPLALSIEPGVKRQKLMSGDREYIVTMVETEEEKAAKAAARVAKAAAKAAKAAAFEKAKDENAKKADDRQGAVIGKYEAEDEEKKAARRAAYQAKLAEKEEICKTQVKTDTARNAIMIEARLKELENQKLLNALFGPLQIAAYLIDEQIYRSEDKARAVLERMMAAAYKAQHKALKSVETKDCHKNRLLAICKTADWDRILCCVLRALEVRARRSQDEAAAYPEAVQMDHLRELGPVKLPAAYSHSRDSSLVHFNVCVTLAERLRATRKGPDGTWLGMGTEPKPKRKPAVKPEGKEEKKDDDAVMSPMPLLESPKRKPKRKQAVKPESKKKDDDAVMSSMPPLESAQPEAAPHSPAPTVTAVQAAADPAPVNVVTPRRVRHVAKASPSPQYTAETCLWDPRYNARMEEIIKATPKTKAQIAYSDAMDQETRDAQNLDAPPYWDNPKYYDRKIAAEVDRERAQYEAHLKVIAELYGAPAPKAQ